mmetsp:Transcript_40573/g.53408  ORF Transcript_40573/g.53408 Transcript_40573/m.53408 type:complete len:270 (+) Transcript_40573:67-876(+)
MWDISDTVFDVRGPNYLEDGIKIPSTPAFASLMHMEMFEVPERTDNVIQRLGHSSVVSLLKKHCHNPPFVIALNFQIPGATKIDCNVYWAVPSWVEEDPNQFDPNDPIQADKSSFNKSDMKGSSMHRLFYQFINGNDDFRNNRFKLIPHMIEGRWVVKKAVGSVPTLLGQKVTQRYFRGDGYLEVDIDVGSSYVASKILRVIRKATLSLVIDVGFLLQGESEDELPEQMVGLVRFVRLNWDHAEDAERFGCTKKTPPKSKKKSSLSYFF